MGKETLEEAAENHQCGGYDWQKEKRKSFIDGAKWMKEQSKAMEKEQMHAEYMRGWKDGLIKQGPPPPPLDRKIYK